MANLKTSQLPVAATLTGTELVEMVQSGANTQTTVATLGAAISSLAAVVGNPNVSAISSAFSWQFGWAVLIPQASNGFMSGGTSNLTPTFTNSNNFSSASFQAMNGAGANLAASVQMGLLSTPASANSVEITCQSIDTNAGSGIVACTRAFANGFPVAGFTLTMYFAMTATQPLGGVFVGFNTARGIMSSATTPSTLLNSMGLMKDQGDTTLSFAINNGSGTAQKTSLGAGVTLASLQGHLLRFVLACDGLGNVTMALTDLEAGGQSYSITYPTATAKLPTVNTQLAFHAFFTNGGTANVITTGFKSIFFTFGLGCL